MAEYDSLPNGLRRPIEGQGNWDEHINFDIDALDAHLTDATAIHGITDTAQLATLNTVQVLTGQKTFQAATAATVAQIIKGAASQTANLLELQNSVGSVLSRFDSIGSLRVGNSQLNPNGIVVLQSLTIDNGGASAAGSGQMHVQAAQAGAPTVVIRGTGSQTGNLQEWQNSAGATLAIVNSVGAITSNTEDITARASLSGFMRMGNVGPGGEAGIAFAPDHGVKFWKSAANTIKTDDSVHIEDANVILGTTTGTKIGTATAQKLAFWNATPVIQPTAVADATDAATAITQLNALLARMRTIGLIAA